MAPTPDHRLPAMPAELGDVLELAMDLRLSTMHRAQEAWRYVDPALWYATRNPWLILQTISESRLRELAADASFLPLVEEGVRDYRARLAAPTWFAHAHPDAALRGVAYLSLEFGLTDALPLYSGGLGNVAGDQLKSASDLGVPVTGVGLLYQRGYFRQTIDETGAQREFHPYNDPGQLPIRPVRDADGSWARIALQLPGRPLWLRAWEAHVGRVRLYLLDANDPMNAPADRGITAELYGGGIAQRLWQEIVLGIGGWSLLRRLGLDVDVCHLNEGHAAFAVLERARAFMVDHAVPFDVALAITRIGNVFTTHTPVTAGFDRFPAEMVRRALGGYLGDLGLDVEQVMALGRLVPGDRDEPLNMAYLAIRGSGAVNGVSRLHGAVSRALFQALFPRWPTHEVPVGHVTNGVHVQSWVSTEADAVWTPACGDGWWNDASGEPARCLAAVDDATLWQCRTASRAKLVRYLRHRLAAQLAADGRAGTAAEDVFDPNVLTLGLARRFATYKRPTLLLHDPDRLLRLLTDPQRPVQLVLAGKAHPYDAEGKALLQQWGQFARRPEARAHVVFLADYDITLAEHLVEGVDVWLNTPRRPWEASGTSGMKILANGGLNLSALDGWWAEAWTPEVGWAFGGGAAGGDVAATDAAEAAQLYRVLEEQVVPCFYARDALGVPRRWVATMRASMATLTPRYASSRTLREYTERYYLPAAAAYRARAADGGRLGAEVARWRRDLAHRWHTVRIGAVDWEARDGGHRVSAQVYLGDLAPESVRVELFADADGDGLVVPMAIAQPLPGAANGFCFTADVDDARPPASWTARGVPHHPAVRVPLEAGEILWQR